MLLIFNRNIRKILKIPEGIRSKLQGSSLCPRDYAIVRKRLIALSTNRLSERLKRQKFEFKTWSSGLATKKKQTNYYLSQSYAETAKASTFLEQC